MMAESEERLASKLDRIDDMNLEMLRDHNEKMAEITKNSNLMNAFQQIFSAAEVGEAHDFGIALQTVFLRNPDKRDDIREFMETLVPSEEPEESTDEE